MGISQDPAGSRGTPGEYGNFTRRSVEDAAPYKARVFDRQLVRVGSASPRLPRPLRGLAMTNRDWCPFNDGLYGLPVRRRERHAAPLHAPPRQPFQVTVVLLIPARTVCPAPAKCSPLHRQDRSARQQYRRSHFSGYRYTRHRRGEGSLPSASA